MWRRILLIFFILLLISAALASLHWSGTVLAVFFGALLMVGVRDLLQKKHTILRNFPIIGHFRYLLESIRPEIQQYFVESDTNGAPVPRIFRNAIYQRAKGDIETVPFGSELNLYADSYKWINHSCFPAEIHDKEFRVRIGGEHCTQPYEASLLNISAMSYGALGHVAISALGKGAKLGGFYHNTGEGGLSPYHLATGADIVWQLGTAYFGARDSEGRFSPEAFAENATLAQVKMIEIKISQGAKPGHGGVLPGAKVTEEIAKIRRVTPGKTVVSPPGHSAFKNPLEMCKFIQQLRQLSGGKPVGIKFCLGRRDDFIQMCEAMRDSQLLPDFITVDGGEGGTGAAPFDFINYVGSPLNEALYFVDTCLTEFGLRKKIRVIASGKVFTGYDMFEKLALGADLCNSARGMMIALGCIQAYRCNTNSCPTGIATNDEALQRGLNVADKSVRVNNYHNKTVLALSELMAAAGLVNPEEIELKHISTRYRNRIRTLEEVYKHTADLSHHESHDRQADLQTQPQRPTPVDDSAAIGLATKAKKKDTDEAQIRKD
jgi:glutamate synthase domain-containing protein 2